jgi:hypothetical protein
MSYDPLQARDPEPRQFKNQVKCVVNEIVSLNDLVALGIYRILPEGAKGNEPYWNIRCIALDAKLDDGSPIYVNLGGKLFTKEGKPQDNKQRPTQVAKAFAAHGISVFPGDPTGKFDAFCASIGQPPIGPNPSYDATKVVGNCFTLLSPDREKDKFGAPLPIAVLGPDFIYTGEVRTVTRKSSDIAEDGTVTPAVAAPGADVLAPESVASLATLLEAINGKPVDGTDFFDLLRATNLPQTLMLDGQSLLGAAVSGALISTLAEKGLIDVSAGTVTVK